MQKHSLTKEVPSFHVSPNLTPTERVEMWKHNQEQLAYRSRVAQRRFKPF